MSQHHADRSFNNEKDVAQMVGELRLEYGAQGYLPDSKLSCDPEIDPPAPMLDKCRETPSQSADTSSNFSVSRTDADEVARAEIYNDLIQDDEFRVLQVAISGSDDMISCTLAHSHLGDAPVYIALSYAWGHVDVSHKIQVNDHDFYVSQSVFSALSSLRHQAAFEACNRQVWVDAICINQKDAKEKTTQVRMMSDIYRQSSLVIAWLGEMTAQHRRGFNLIADVSKKLKLGNIYDGTSITEEQLISTVATAEQIGIPYVGHRLWEDVQAVFQKPWWSRVWIIQELLCAPQFLFLCGSAIFEGEDLFHFAGNLVKYPFLSDALLGPRGKPLGSTCAASLAQWREAWLAGYRMNITACLFKSLGFEATDERDKIFAMALLSCDMDANFIDYSKPVRQVLVELARHMIAVEDPRMDILSMAQVFTRPAGIPSWIPCWTQGCSDGPAGLQRPGICPGFSAGIQRIKIPPRPPIDIDEEDALVVHSQYLDTIVALLDGEVESEVPPIPLGPQRHLGTAEFHEWFTAMYEHDYQARTLNLELVDMTEALGNYPTGQDLSEVFWRSRIMDDQHCFDSSILEAYLALNREAMGEIIAENIYTEMTLHDHFAAGKSLFAPGIWQLGMKYEDQARDYQMKQIAVSDYSKRATCIRGRNYAITESGYVGWVPKECTVGDQIHIVAGARVPYVLRQMAGRELNGLSAVTLVGDAYVHGLMTGTDIYTAGILAEMKEVRIV